MNRYFEMLKHYMISGGQVPRRESRIFTLLTLIVGFLLGYVAIFVGYSGLGIQVLFLFGTIIGICGLFVLIPSIAVSIRRLHDVDRSGWWLLVSLIPLIGSTVLLGFVAQDSRSNENQGGCNPEDAAV